MNRPAHRLLLAALLLLSLATLLAALAIGSVTLSPLELWQQLSGGGEAVSRTILLELRLPRVIGAFAVGGMLALAGAQMQVLLGNPLADPYILGVSGGAAIGALLAMLFGAPAPLLSLAALGGALLSLLLVFRLAQGGSGWHPTRLLLSGVVIAAGWGALISLILAVAPQEGLRGMLFWLMGDLGEIAYPGSALLLLLLGLLLSMPLARSLNLLARGELQAGALGVEVKPLKIALYLLASLLTAFAVTLGGSIGFVGLVIPHMVRLLAGSDHRVVLPAAVLLGGTFLLLADTLARTVIAPQQLPVGVITALIGVPLFLYLLHRSSQL